MKRVFPYSGGFATIVKPGFGELALSNRGGLINRVLTFLATNYRTTPDAVANGGLSHYKRDPFATHVDTQHSPDA